VDGVPFARISPPATARVHAPLSCRARPPPTKFAAADGVRRDLDRTIEHMRSWRIDPPQPVDQPRGECIAYVKDPWWQARLAGTVLW
jgi:hypothetical protein